MLTINDIKTIVENFSSLHPNANLSKLDSILVKQLLTQTNLKSITEVDLVLDAYENIKTNWLKKGLENVLLHGEFPVTIKEVTNPIIPSVPTQPFVWPTNVPPVKFEPYCNYNDYKGESLTKVK